jgi:hypothetical protein
MNMLLSRPSMKWIIFSGLVFANVIGSVIFAGVVFAILWAPYGPFSHPFVAATSIYLFPPAIVLGVSSLFFTLRWWQHFTVVIFWGCLLFQVSFSRHDILSDGRSQDLFVKTLTCALPAWLVMCLLLSIIGRRVARCSVVPKLNDGGLVPYDGNRDE